ncbi:MAG TPA: putative metal-binding motif-containing protein [Polyangiales bacterium]|nr:putative metal-binding motif-containing protein [Polyangiales bacterium]
MRARVADRSSLLACLLACQLTGCSLVKLSDEIVQGHCRNDADCAELNQQQAQDDFDPCQRWQCNDDEKLCRYGALDADGDGQSPAAVMNDGKSVTCQRDPLKQDCADDDADIGAGLPELCDEQDNDCDGLADEGALESSTTGAVVFGKPTRAGAGDGEAASDAAYARDPMSGEIALAYGVLQSGSTRPGATLLDPELSASTSTSTLAVEHVTPALGQHVAVAPLPGSRFAYALVTTSGAPRVVVGVWNTNATQVLVQPELAEQGLACLPGEECRDVLAPAVAAQSRDVLVAYLRFDGGDPAGVGCGQLREEDKPADVLANLLLQRGTSSDERLQEQSSSALRLGSSSDLTGPVLLALPPIGAAPQSWLVAYADQDGGVVIDRVQRNGMALEVVQPALIRLTGGTQSSAIALALGETGEDELQLGIVYQRGCGSAARVVLALRSLVDDGGKLAAELVIDGLQVGGASNETNPALGYSAARDTWLVSYRDLTGLRARVVGADGTVHAQQPYSLIERVKPEDGAEVDILPPSMAVFDVGSGFATVAHVLRAANEAPRAFETAHLSCE